ncbi:K(+)-transporting ATPase subunit F [Streptomyces vinaceus]
MRCVKTWPRCVAVPPARGSVLTGGCPGCPGCLCEIALALLGYLVVALIRPEKF